MFIALSQTILTALICYVKKKLSQAFPKHFDFPDIDVWSKSTLSAVSRTLYKVTGFVKNIL